MKPVQNLNPLTPGSTTKAAIDPLPVAQPLVARRVQPTQAKPPTTLETVSKVADGVNQLVKLAKKYLGSPATTQPPVARRAMPLGEGTAETELLPESAFVFELDSGSANGNVGGVDMELDVQVDELLTEPDLISPPIWDWNSMLNGLDPTQLMQGFDPGQLLNGLDPENGW